MDTLNKTEILSAEQPPHEALRLGYRKPDGNKGDEKRIRDAMIVIADLISTGHEEYLPLFQRLEKDAEKWNHNNDAKKRAFELSTANKCL